jgi:hypothetical protein
MKKIIAFLKKKDLYFGLIRYALAISMMPYGISKIFKTQFVLSPSLMSPTTLEQMSGKTLTWAFLGYSSWFEVLLGFLELIPALLLLFRRTALTGTILLLPITLNVYLINMALNLWDGTKLIALVLLVLNCLLLLFEWKKIRDIVLIVIGKTGMKFTGWELAFNVLLLVGINYAFVKQLMGYRAQENELTGDWFNNKPNEWVLQAEKIKDSTLVRRYIRVYFGAGGNYSELSENNTTTFQTTAFDNNRSSYSVDEKRKIINFFDSGNALLDAFTYTIKGNTLQLNRVTGNSKKDAFTQLFEKRVMNNNKPD